MFPEAALHGEDADDRTGRRAAYHPRPASSSCLGIDEIATPRMGAHRPLDTSAITSGWSWYVVAITMACAIRAGSSVLKMPEPSKLPSAPACIMSAASAGVLIPPAEKLTTGSRPRR